MVTVTNETKEAWASESSQKHIRIQIIGVGYISENEIAQGSFSMSESIMSSNSIEFVGCIARKITFTTSAFTTLNLKNKRIKAWVQANDTEEIQVFNGIIDESKKQSTKGLKDIVAYDDLYRLSQVDASSWWNSLGKTTIGDTVYSFFDTFHETGFLIGGLWNWAKPCFGGTKRKVTRFTCLDYLMQLCQINGVIGYMDGSGIFSIKHLRTSTTTEIPYFRVFDYADYSVKAIERVTIRNGSEDAGVSYPYSGQNTYIIQGNIFAFDQTASDLLEMAEGVFREVEGISYKPFEAGHNAYPYLECGDIVRYIDYDDEGVLQTVDCYVMSRILSGDQDMWDDYSAEGEQDQRIFITDLQAQLNDLQNEVDEEQDPTPDGSLYGMVLVEYTYPIEEPTMGGIEDSVSGIVTEV
jgi:hypothetical protein